MFLIDSFLHRKHMKDLVNSTKVVARSENADKPIVRIVLHKVWYQILLASWRLLRQDQVQTIHLESLLKE